MKHNNKYRIYEIDQDLINFFRGEDLYQNRPAHKVDKQIYSHYPHFSYRSDKYIGIVIEFQNQLYFAPLTHDGNKMWENRDDSCDFEKIYDLNNKYAGSLLLCKALPLTHNLVKYLTFKQISNKEGEGYALLCENEVNYLNSSNVHDKIQEKMQNCIYGYQTSCMQFRVDYQLAAKNVKEYNELQSEELKEKSSKIQKIKI